MTVDPAVRAEFRRLRSTGMSASPALQWARNRPDDAYPGIEWTDDGRHSVVLRGDGQVGGLDVRVRVSYDDDPMHDGEFTDTWQPGAVQNPNFRPHNRNNTYQWYVGVTGDIDDHRRALSASGVARHDAYTTALGYLRDDARRAAQPEQYIITVTVGRDGVDLADAVVHGFDVPDDLADARRQFIDHANSLIGEAIDEARNTLDKLHADAAPPAPRRCFYVDETMLTEHGYVPSVVIEGESGHRPMTGNGQYAAPWYWGHEIDTARRIAADANAALGLSRDDVHAIIASSFHAGTVRVIESPELPLGRWQAQYLHPEVGRWYDIGDPQVDRAEADRAAAEHEN